MTERHRPDEEAKLDALLRDDLPPERDPLFRLAVLARLERQRFRRRIAAVAVCAAATVAVGVYAAAISAWLVEDVTRIAGVLAGSAAVVWTFPALLEVLPSTLRHLVRALFVRVTVMVSRSFEG